MGKGKTMTRKINNKRVKNKNKKIESGNEAANFIKLIILVTVLFAAFYLITLFINKEDKTKKEDTPATIQYDNILLGSILEQPNETYYVLIKNSDDINSDLYSTYISMYKSASGAKRFYYVDLNNPLNKKFVATESNLTTSDISKIKIKEATLLGITSGKISNVYEGSDSIKTFLKGLAAVKEAE